MSREQTAYVGDDIKVVVNVIGSNGNHEAATIDLSTTRLDGYSTVPTVNTIATGIYEIVFSGVTPAPVEADRLICKINGTVTSTGTAWTTYGVPIIIVAEMKGTNNASTFDATVDQVTTANASDVTAIKAKTDQLAFSVANQVDANSLTGGSDATAANQTAISNAIAALNDFDPASDVVANVTTVGNMRGTDGANTIAPDNAGIASNGTAISNLNDIDATGVENAVWDAATASHLLAGTFGKLMELLKKANRAIDAEVSGTPTATGFDTNLLGYTDGAFDHELLVFVSGTLSGEARPILSYTSANGRITFEEPLTGAPSATDEFVILPYHTTPTSEIQSGLARTTDLATVIKTGQQYTATAQSGDTINVTIS